MSWGYDLALSIHLGLLAAQVCFWWATIRPGARP